jgi:subtilisin family serine protease
VQPDGKYVVWDGTSGAAPLVSGLVALVRSEYPDLDAANVIERVTATADPNGQEVPSALYGNGLVDPVAALTADVPEIDPDTLVDGLADWITIHRRADVDAPDPAAETETVVPIADPPLPRSDGAQTLLPTQWTLAYITVPLSLVAGFGTLAALLGIGAARHTRRTVRTREQ